MLVHRILALLGIPEDFSQAIRQGKIQEELEVDFFPQTLEVRINHLEQVVDFLETLTTRAIPVGEDYSEVIPTHPLGVYLEVLETTHQLQVVFLDLAIRRGRTITPDWILTSTISHCSLDTACLSKRQLGSVPREVFLDRATTSIKNSSLQISQELDTEETFQAMDRAPSTTATS